MVWSARTAYATSMSQARSEPTSYRTALAVAGLMGALATGCQRQAEVTLYQPFAPHAQQQLQLIGDGAYIVSTGEQRACLLTFALPGALRGPRAFVIYVCGPDVDGPTKVDAQDPSATRGFLIQEVGALAGRTDFSEGAVVYRTRPLQPGWVEVELDVRCEDGTTIRGKALAENVPNEVRAFERQYAADVTSLIPAGPPAEGQTTHSRATAP